MILQFVYDLSPFMISICMFSPVTVHLIPATFLPRLDDFLRADSSSFQLLVAMRIHVADDTFFNCDMIGISKMAIDNYRYL